MTKSNSWPHESRHKRGYGTAWDRLRKLVLERDSYLCQCSHCKAEGRTTVANEVDHIVNRARAAQLGWTREKTEDLGNLQAINKDCHLRKSIEEKGGAPKPKRRIGLDGFPERSVSPREG